MLRNGFQFNCCHLPLLSGEGLKTQGLPVCQLEPDDGPLFVRQRENVGNNLKVVAKLRRGHRKRYHLCKLPTDCWQVVESSVPWRDHQCPRRVGYCLCAGAVGVRVGRAPSYEVSPAHRCLKVISVMAFQNILIPHYPSAFKLVYSPGFLISLSNPPSCSSQNLRGLLDAPYFDNY